MQRNEAKVWINYHGEIFPEWGEWYGKPGKAARAMMFEAIVKALRPIDLQDAKEASDAMLGGNPKKPFHEEDHLAAIIRAAEDIQRERKHRGQPRPVDRQRTYACPLCLDSGLVECYRRNLRATMYVVCSCDQGGKHLTHEWGTLIRRQQSAQRYDPEKCYRVGDDSPRWLRVREQVEADIAAGVSRQLAGVEEF